MTDRKREARCQLCEGVCPECGGPVGEKAGSLDWVLCSMCHATFLHTHVREPGDGSTASS